MPNKFDLKRDEFELVQNDTISTVSYSGKKFLELLDPPSKALPEYQEWQNELFTNLEVDTPDSFSETNHSLFFKRVSSEDIFKKFENFLRLIIVKNTLTKNSNGNYFPLTEIGSIANWLNNKDHISLFIHSKTLKAWWNSYEKKVETYLQSEKSNKIRKDFKEIISMLIDLFSEFYREINEVSNNANAIPSYSGYSK